MLITSQQMDLRLTAQQDLDFVLAAEQDEPNQRYIGQWGRDKHSAAITDKDILHLIVQDKTGQPAGYVILTGLQDPNLSVCLLRIVIDIKGCGYGTSTLALLKDWIFNNTETHRLWLDVKEFNSKARHVYEAAGLKVEGILREAVKHGDSFDSMVIMSILRQEYEEQAGEPK
ncbi:acetyltransferase [Paenibacillus sp. FSL R7-0273]|uniref:GNAT family N-acetyltransferase n=1 Tax=Paenibacillus sp. FSL R7-0273 TaxID=1536772 RepID=UPI0004F6C127|nr:GNAT family protein [Paenibacillus sp. FSL R7-0273]AIQ49838.1 acetyltransferase [Paenibacillus sp. FSL R7-0273]OMF92422.1 GNAT family N-acetyltransferase [Paenibacillus sp. FSL R7-0273]